ncbi:MAG: Fe-S cluster protein [Deltaproteobacteria bacterium]|nr:Fe-S cluster protein [Deltaproteobacteria bacterium]
MLLKGWVKEISRAECRPEAQTVHCIARLEQNIGEVIPYLNAVLGGFSYVKEPPSVTFRSQGKLISVHDDHIAINALQDAEEAEKILRWLQGEINNAWSKRTEITPSFQAAPRPQVFEILRLLPKTNCRKCGQPTCIVFATLAMEGGLGADDCPDLAPDNKKKLQEYLGRFRFDW